nr:protein kinase (EC 2.7.1.37) GSK-3-alpha - rabbit (fragments) [Oryctolagus cuniculus]
TSSFAEPGASVGAMGGGVGASSSGGGPVTTVVATLGQPELQIMRYFFYSDIKPQNLLVDPDTAVLKVLGTPTEMNPNYTEFKPQIKAHPFTKSPAGSTPLSQSSQALTEAQTGSDWQSEATPQL